MLRHLLNRIPYKVLIPASLVLGLAPFHPEPHLLEKLRLLSQGDLLRPIDVFDLCLHGTPALVLLTKLCFEFRPQ